MESRSITGQADTALYLKAQVDHLQGRCEELRAELRLSRTEATKSATDLEQTKQKVVF